MSTPLLSLYHRITRWPGGHWLFSRTVCFKAPYFASISPRITVLEPGRCEGRFTDRRKVRSLLGTVHGIAMCNLAELTARLMIRASIPAGMRWVPAGMQVQYRAEARGTLHAIALPSQPIVAAEQAYALPVVVSIRDCAGDEVFQARIDMWLSPAHNKKAA